MLRYELLDERLYEWMTKKVVDVAELSPCHRSKCGAIIATGPVIFSSAYNSMPCNVVGECLKDSLPENFKSDKTCCVHAEQRAIVNMICNGKQIYSQKKLFFIRLDKNNEPVFAGHPYCTICSKMALDNGIEKFCLYHREGWIAYDTKWYNELSFKFRPEYKNITSFYEILKLHS